jgi:D-hydroxyproline dehydrogenase subunit gamma
MSVLFRPLPAAPASVPPVTVTVVLDGAAIDLPAGMMLAAALLARGRAATGRSLHLSAPRGPFCLMGSCFECVAEVDGRPQRTCRLVVRAGMRIALGAAGRPERTA